jgi:2OG-Fe(II) oxygenase superfamily
MSDFQIEQLESHQSHVSEASGPYAISWQGAQDSPMGGTPSVAELFAQLASWEIAAIQIPGALQGQLCAKALAQVPREALAAYNTDYYPTPAYRFGPIANEHRVDGALAEAYWPQAAMARERCSGLLDLEIARAKLLEVLTVGDVPACPATLGSSELYWGIVREINDGALPHWDDISRELPASQLDDPPDAQLALNLFLSAPEHGGETLVWHRAWVPSDEEHRQGFGYDVAMLGEQASVALKPRTGDAIIINSCAYHSVLPCEGRRTTLSCFAGVTDAGLRVWS